MTQDLSRQLSILLYHDPGGLAMPRPDVPPGQLSAVAAPGQHVLVLRVVGQAGQGTGAVQLVDVTSRITHPAWSGV